MSPSNRPSTASAVRRFFTNPDTGEIVIAQRPNALMQAHLASRSASRLAPGAPPTQALSAVATGTLVIWALLELTDGDSPFRRTVGAAVLVGGAARAVRYARDRAAG